LKNIVDNENLQMYTIIYKDKEKESMSGIVRRDSQIGEIGEMKTD